MHTPTPDRPDRFRALFVLFFLSGVSGLIYESIWSRYIKQFVGSAATAQILVLSLFMGGMSIGALLAGRYVARMRAPVVVYGLIEGLIGLYALLFPTLYAGVTRSAYDTIFPAVGGGLAVAVAKWSLAGLMIIPPCVLLGMTFPLMSVGILRRARHRSGEILSTLYFANSFGAALGAILSGFQLVPWVGLPGAITVAGALNLLIMLVAIRDRAVTQPIVATVRSAGCERSNGARAGLFLAVAFGTGLSSFMYEIGWIRLLSTVLGAATHSFEIMLAVFIFGLACGGLWVRKRMDRYQRPELALAVVQLTMGLCAVATIPTYRLGVWAMGGLLSDQWVELMGSELVRTEALWVQFNMVKILICMAMMFPAAFCAGMTLPLLTHVMLKRGHAEGAVGKVYGFNTFGSIIGAVAAGLLFMPMVGIKGVLVLGALVDMILGLLLFRRQILGDGSVINPSKLFGRAAVGAVTTVGVGLAIPIDPTVLTSTVFRHGRMRLPSDYEVRSYVDGRTASVTVVKTESETEHHVIYTNGKPDASVMLRRWPEGRDVGRGPMIAGDEPNQFLVGLIPLMLRPEAKHGALIGFGSGVTCHTILSSPRLERLDTVEIEPEMVEGARFFMPVNYRAYRDPRSAIHYDDAKAYFARSGARYDFIISEPTNPWVSGVSSLFTVEFYQEVKRYLKPGGLMAQWLQGYELSDELTISVLAAIDREFSDYLIVRIGSSDWVIVAAAEGDVGLLDEAPLHWPDAQDAFALLGIYDVGQIDGLIAANRRLLHPFLADKTPNRDSHPILDTGAERARFLQYQAAFLHSLRMNPAPVLEVFGGIHRRAYPAMGIGDLRESHILYELEQAALLMRRYEDPNAVVAVDLSAAPMNRWKDATKALEDGSQAAWNTWLEATYEVYTAVAPQLEIADSPWWRHVVREVTLRSAPNNVRKGIGLLDALARKDPERITHEVTASLNDDTVSLPKPLIAVAGAIMLEMVRADGPTRREFVESVMDKYGTGMTSDDYAFRVIRAYVARSPDDGASR